MPVISADFCDMTSQTSHGTPEALGGRAGLSTSVPALPSHDDTPVAIEVADLSKTFRLPHEQVHTLKERVIHPFRRPEIERFEALRGVSFDVRQGEFFGIVGRNGSGKSTLLKCLAGIYAADSGRIAVAGRVSTFIELGVGFNMDLPARDNILINATMLGLTQREAKARTDAILEFAELENFVDLKLKNYSSGMLVRLAFSVMIQVDADVLLIDEVLAVGDASFQQKCFDEFARLRQERRTVILVTHEMVTEHDNLRPSVPHAMESTRCFWKKDLIFGGVSMNSMEAISNMYNSLTAPGAIEFAKIEISEVPGRWVISFRLNAILAPSTSALLFDVLIVSQSKLQRVAPLVKLTALNFQIPPSKLSTRYNSDSPCPMMTGRPAKPSDIFPMPKSKALILKSELFMLLRSKLPGGMSVMREAKTTSSLESHSRL